MSIDYSELHSIYNRTVEQLSYHDALNPKNSDATYLDNHTDSFTKGRDALYIYNSEIMRYQGSMVRITGAVTDEGIYICFGNNADFYEWGDIQSVELDFDDNIKIKTALYIRSFSAVCLLGCELFEDSIDCAAIIDMLNEMAEATYDDGADDDDDDDNDDEMNRLRAEEELEKQRREIETERRDLERRKAEEEREALERRIAELEFEKKRDAEKKLEQEEKLRKEKQMSDEQHKEFCVNVTESNIDKIFSAGKEVDKSEFDLSVLSRLTNAEANLESKRKEGNALSPSELGDTKAIAAKQEKLSNGIKDLENLKKRLSIARSEWDAQAYPLFMSASHANTRILLGTSGFNISAGTKGGKTAPGVYTTSVPVTGTINVNHLPSAVAEDIQVKAKSLLEKWRNYLAINTEVWRKVAQITGNKSPKPQTTVDEVIESVKENLNSAYAQAKKYEEWNQDVKALESEVDELRSRRDAMMKRILEVDPLLTAFSLPNGKMVYTQQWLARVKAVAELRESMPYLPLYWDAKSLGTVFDWKKAIEIGKPNLFIEAATDEGDYGRVDMLDNFIATMLLAFPVKDLHFTVIEQNRSNTFVTNLPKKLCDVYNIDGDSDAIDATANRLNEVLRSERGSHASGLRPREIVVFVGLRKKDNRFPQVMEKFREPIEKGKQAGIYFVAVLDEDITKYDWMDADANRFAEYFTPYSSILTDKKDKNGNPIPDYELLKNKAEYIEEEKPKKGILAEMVINYLSVETSRVPNKVYELIENGTLYTDKLISDLDDQPRQEAGKLIVPIAEDGEDKKINMVLDDQDYMFYFILGMTGSGKSFTLHTILTNLMLKYDPSILDVVIMDFKGGVEMADYRGVPHVSSILANGADVQVAGEMLMSLNKEMTRRDELFTQSGTKNITEYNRYALRNGKEPMKNIIFLVDECQDLFKIDRPINSSDFIAMLAKKGRIYGIHMILATQTLRNSGIPKDALSQFSDFIFMKCAPDDVVTCGITNRDLQMNVAKLNKGEIYYCHGQEEPVHGFVYNYAGKGNVYKDKTLANLKGKRFPRPKKEQFYFDSQQIFTIDDAEIKALVKKSKSGLKTVPTTVLGKNLSVNLDTIYTKLGKGDGSNLLIVGANDRLQGERVLWNAVLSLYKVNKAIGQDARYYILPNIPEDVEASAFDAHEKRLAIVKSLGNKPEVTLVDEDERADTIERVAATVRGRMHLAESDKKTVDKLDAIYLIIPNQQMFAKNMGRRPKGLDSLDSGINLPIAESMSGHSSDSVPVFDSLGFEGLKMPEAETSAPGFDSIDFGNFDSPSFPASNNQVVQSGKPGRDYDEELRYILEYGPGVNVHVLLQTTGPDKIYSGDAMREKEMTMLFNDIVLLKMLQASTMSLPVDSRVVEKLSAEPKSLRAIAYNVERDPRIIVPFDFN